MTRISDPLVGKGDERKALKTERITNTYRKGITKSRRYGLTGTGVIREGNVKGTRPSIEKFGRHFVKAGRWTNRKGLRAGPLRA